MENLKQLDDNWQVIEIMTADYKDLVIGTDKEVLLRAYLPEYKITDKIGKADSCRQFN